MSFDLDTVGRNLPAYLSTQDKGRLQQALSDFSSYTYKERQTKESSAAEYPKLEEPLPESSKPKLLTLEDSQKLYSHFYLHESDEPEYLLQADIIDSIRRPFWVSNQQETDYASYRKEYIRALMISNTCDVDAESKERYIPKEVSFVPVIPFDEFIRSVTHDHRIRPQEEQIKHNLRNQQYSNLFYLPTGNGFEEHIALLDQPFCFPADELAAIFQGVIANRVISLSQWAYYFFTLKLSYHLCRLPEDEDRKPSPI